MQAKRTILVVDDIAMFRELEAVFLARCGRVVTAASGGEALALLHREQPDIVLLDFSLADADAESVCRKIKSDPGSAHIPVIAVTRSGDPGDHARAIHAGADDVLSKPLSRSGLVETVNRFIRLESPRGLPRIELEVPVRMRWDARDAAGTVRNVSRGGVFVSSDAGLCLDAQLALDFTLPEADLRVCTNAKVVWQRAAGTGEGPSDPPGMGMRFVNLSGDLARQLDDFVHERALKYVPATFTPQQRQRRRAG